MKIFNKDLIESIFKLYKFNILANEPHTSIYNYKRYNTLLVKITIDNNNFYNVYVLEEITPIHFVKRYDLSKGRLDNKKLIEHIKFLIKESNHI